MIPAPHCRVCADGQAVHTSWWQWDRAALATRTRHGDGQAPEPSPGPRSTATPRQVLLVIDAHRYPDSEDDPRVTLAGVAAGGQLAGTVVSARASRF